MEVLLVIALIVFVIYKTITMPDKSPKGPPRWLQIRNEIEAKIAAKKRLREAQLSAAKAAAESPTTVEVAVPGTSQSPEKEAEPVPVAVPVKTDAPSADESVDLNVPAFLRQQGKSLMTLMAEMEAKDKRSFAAKKAADTRRAARAAQAEQKDKEVTEQIRDLLSLADSIPQ